MSKAKRARAIIFVLNSYAGKVKRETAPRMSYCVFYFFVFEVRWILARLYVFATCFVVVHPAVLV